MTATEWLVVLAGAVAIAVVNWWFLIAGNREAGKHGHHH